MPDYLYIYHHDDCLLHDTGPVHPENPGRIQALMTSLRTAEELAPAEYLLAPLGTYEQVLPAPSPSHRSPTANAPRC